MEKELVVVIDFGGQYNQLVARRVRECNVYCEIYSYKTDLNKIKAMNPKGIILTGGPASCYEPGAATCSEDLFHLGVPVLGLCYGDLTKSPCGNQIMGDIVDEIFAVMAACGYTTYWPNAEAYKKELFGSLIPTTYAHVSSTLQDIRRKHPTEIDTLTGKIIELGQAHGIAVPVNQMLYREIKLLESNY